MAKLLSLITFASFLTIISPASAYKIGDLYKFCKTYTDGGFELNSSATVACYGYVRGVINSSSFICHNFQGLNNEVVAIFGSKALPSNIDAVAQIFVNEAKGKPESWEFNAEWMVAKAAKSIAPCE